MDNFKGLRYFRPREFNQPEKMSHNLLQMLDIARHQAGIPFTITSSFRHNSGTSHGRGTGVDIRCLDSQSRFKIVSALLSTGFNRIGVYDRHIHADIDFIHNAPQEVIWWGRSQ